jgi:phosphomannomutase
VSGPVTKLTAFKAYDVRGRVPDELNEDIAYLTGRAFARFVAPRRVVVGRDMRPTSGDFAAAITRGLTDAGVDVVDIGEVGTEMVYFATFALELDGGIMVTASHNPGDYNGMKLVREQAIPISGDTGLKDMEAMVVEALNGAGGLRAPGARHGSTEQVDIDARYVEHLLTYLDPGVLRPLRILANPGNGMAGPVLDLLEPHLPLDLVKMYNDPDGTFPHGIPNPLLPENQQVTAQAVRDSGADLGLAWDGDFDRCFFFDETGTFIDGYYLVGLLAQHALRRRPGAKIIHDPRLVWNTIELVREAGGIPLLNKSGHAFIKARMRTEDAAYGGEMSAHHYFREFAYADSGMIPWLVVVELLSRSGRSLHDLVGDRMARYPVSGEINREIADPGAALRRLEETYAPAALSVDRTDGISLEFAQWRCNVRSSNTEPVLRLNVESRGDAALMQDKTQEILELLCRDGACV